MPIQTAATEHLAFGLQKVLRANPITHADQSLDVAWSRRSWLVYETSLKRLLDLVLATLGLAASAPIWLAIAIAIKVDSPGRVIFVQERVGLHGRRFRFYKFRSMHVDAEQRLAEVQSKNEVLGPVFKMRRDPRVTKVGAFLRRTSLDELPQLVNVLKGDMSLVGPRPEDPKYVAHYTPEQRRVLSVRPGMTGPAVLAFIDEEEMLRGGDPESTYVNEVMPRKLAIDLDYVKGGGFGADLRILGRTAAAVIQRAFRRGSPSPPR